MVGENLKDQFITVSKLARLLAKDRSFVSEIGLDQFPPNQVVLGLTDIFGFILAMYNTAKSIFTIYENLTLDEKFIKLIYSRFVLEPELVKIRPDTLDYAQECYEEIKSYADQSQCKWDNMPLYAKFFEICVRVLIEESYNDIRMFQPNKCFSQDKNDYHKLRDPMESLGIDMGSRPVLAVAFKGVFSHVDWELDDKVESPQVNQVETPTADTATTKAMKTWLATVLCLFLGPLGMFYFGWRPAIAALALFGSVSLSFHAYATTATKATELPPWVRPSLILVWAYVGWRHAKGWNTQPPSGKSNYFASFNSGVLSTLYLIWLNILISLPVLSILVVIDGYMNSQLGAGIIPASLRLLIAFVWFWAGRFHIFPWCERTFGRLRGQQVTQNEKVILLPKKALGPDSKLKEYPMLYLYFDDFAEITRGWNKSHFEVARHDSDIRSCFFSVDKIMGDENLFLELYKNKLVRIRLWDGTVLVRDDEEFYWDRVTHPEKYTDEISHLRRPDLIASRKETLKRIGAVVESIKLRYGL